jgi:hypothetical protein
MIQISSGRIILVVCGTFLVGLTVGLQLAHVRNRSVSQSTKLVPEKKVENRRTDSPLVPMPESVKNKPEDQVETANKTSSISKSRALLMQLLSQPDYNASFAEAEAEKIRREFVRFLKSLHLTSDQISKTIDLLTQRKMAVFDSVSSEGKVDTSSLGASMQASNQIVNELDETIGSQNTKALLDYENSYGPTQIAENTVESLNLRLAVIDSDLSDQQRSALVQLLTKSNMTAGQTNMMELASTVLDADQLSEYSKMLEETKFQQEVAAKYQNLIVDTYGKP